MDKAREKTRLRPAWISTEDVPEEELCPDCFKAVGSRNRYRLVCHLGKHPRGLTVTALTRYLKLQQPTVTHHLNALRSVEAVLYEENGRERIYRLNRGAHCFTECRIPY